MASPSKTAWTVTLGDHGSNAGAGTPRPRPRAEQPRRPRPRTRFDLDRAIDVALRLASICLVLLALFFIAESL